MSDTNPLARLTPLLSGSGTERLFGFFNEVDPATATRFRSWLGSASEGETRAAADLLNHSASHREFVGWWRMRDKVSDALKPVAELSPLGSARPNSLGARGGRSTPTGTAKQRSIQWIIIGFVLQFAGRALAILGGGGSLLGLIVLLAGVIVFLGGCTQYAQAKGRSPLFGLLGFFSCIGLLILLLLPERHERARWGSRR